VPSRKTVVLHLSRTRTGTAESQKRVTIGVDTVGQRQHGGSVPARNGNAPHTCLVQGPGQGLGKVVRHLWWRVKAVSGWADRRLGAWLFSFSCLSGGL
jgi:hypothetical protein